MKAATAFTDNQQKKRWQYRLPGGPSALATTGANPELGPAPGPYIEDGNKLNVPMTKMKFKEN